MTSHVDPLLTEIHSSNVIAFMRSQGVSSEQVKEWVISVLRPLYRNEDCLRDLAVEVLAPEAVRIAYLKQDRWAYAALEKLLDLYWASEAQARKECMQICGDWHEAIFQGLSSFWSLYRLRNQSEVLSDDDRVFQQFGRIGALIESVIQPRLRELLGHVRHSRRKDYSLAAIRNLKFGGAVNELVTTSSVADLFRPAPWGLPLHQWRNIAQHHSFVLKQGTIHAEVGESPNRQAITLSPQELHLLDARTTQTFNALEAARTVFAFDNFDDFAATAPVVTPRREAMLVQLTTIISTQGFILNGLDFDHEDVVAEIADMCGGERIRRIAHVSQFLFVVWRHFPSPTVKVRFVPYEGTPITVFSCSGSLCKDIANGVLPFETLAKEFEVCVE